MKNLGKDQPVSKKKRSRALKKVLGGERQSLNLPQNAGKGLVNEDEKNEKSV